MAPQRHDDDGNPQNDRDRDADDGNKARPADPVDDPGRQVEVERARSDKDFSSLPWKKVQAWSVETAGTFDLDSELDLWFSGLGKVRLEFKGGVDIRAISQLIGHYALS